MVKRALKSVHDAVKDDPTLKAEVDEELVRAVGRDDEDEEERGAGGSRKKQKESASSKIKQQVASIKHDKTGNGEGGGE